MIEVNHVSKAFRVSRREAGLKAAAKALFKRQYEEIKALDDISFTIADGEMVGYIGPNGAGKSSTIKILSGILTPDSGSCNINGRTPWKKRREHVRDIGVVFGQRSQLWWDVPVIDSFELLRDIYTIPNQLYQQNLEELVTLLNLEKIIQTPTRQLSLGQRMRCEIAASLLHSPKILFLDEPTIGLDAISKLAVREFILSMNRIHKTTVILTTHDMMDIEALTKRILLIGKGKILTDGTLDQMRSQFKSTKKLVVDFYGDNFNLLPGMTISFAQDQIEDWSYKADEKVHKQSGEKRHCEIQIDLDLISVSDAIACITKQIDIDDISVENTSIDELVASLYYKYQIL